MATFQAQVEGLTGFSLSGSTDPSLNELTQFLKDGVLDVTAKWVTVRPEDGAQFIRVSAETTANDSLDINGAQILAVVREADTNNDWRDCRFIASNFQSRVTDVNSIHYASAYNPAYTILENGIINVFPAPGSTTKAFKVYYINNVPQDKGGAILLYSHSDIKYFPDNKVPLVVKYAAIKALEAKMAFYATDEEDVELVQAISANISVLTSDYNIAFGIVSQAKQSKAAG